MSEDGEYYSVKIEPYGAKDKRKNLVIPSEYEGVPVTVLGEDPNGESEMVAWISYDYTIETIEISDSITVLGSRAIMGLANLKSVQMPDSVTTVCQDAIGKCEKLTEIVFGNGVKTIDFCSLDCESVTKIVIPEGVEVIEHRAFYDCEKATVYCRAQSGHEGYKNGWNEAGDWQTTIELTVVWGYNG